MYHLKQTKVRNKFHFKYIISYNSHMEPTTTTTQTSTAQAAQGAQTTTGQAANAAPVEYNVPDVVMQKYPVWLS